MLGTVAKGGNALGDLNQLKTLSNLTMKQENFLIKKLERAQKQVECGFEITILQKVYIFQDEDVDSKKEEKPIYEKNKSKKH